MSISCVFWVHLAWRYWRWPSITTTCPPFRDGARKRRELHAENSHLAVSGLTVRLPVWPWQQVCVKRVRKWGVRATWIFIMTSSVYWLQRGGQTQVRLFGPPESTVNWPRRRREEGGSEHIAQIRVIQVLPVADSWIDEDENSRNSMLSGRSCEQGTRQDLTTQAVKNDHGRIVRSGARSPANSRRWTNAGAMLGWRRRRRANIAPALGQRLVFAGSLDEPRCTV